MPEDQIHIKDLLLRGIIGINDWERESQQDILINITLFGNFLQAGSSDRIEDGINYRTVTKKVIQCVEESSRFTVEALATDIAKICLEQKGVIRARIRVEKPGALRFARSVGVEIERNAEDFS
jgi:FolB domain-containing protein